MSIYSPYLYRPFREDAVKQEEPFHVYKKIASLVKKATKKEPVDNFDEFCIKMGYDPESVLYTLHYNNLKWNKEPDGFVFWPDMVIQKKEGRCFDFALFMHYYFQYFNVEHILGFMALINPKTLKTVTHAFPIYQSHLGKYYVWHFDGEDISESAILGGLDSPFDVLEVFKSIFVDIYDAYKPKNCNFSLGRACYMTEEEMKGFDAFKDEENLHQTELLNSITDKHIKMFAELAQVKQRLQKGFVADHFTKEELIQDLIQNSTWLPPLTKQQGQLLRKLAKKAGLKIIK